MVLVMPGRNYDYTNQKFIPSATQYGKAQRSLSNNSDVADIARATQALIEDGSNIRQSLGNPYIDFFDITLASTPAAPVTITLYHGFGTRVRFYCVESSGQALPLTTPTIKNNTSSTTDTLVLDVGFTGTFTLRVESVQ